MGGDEIDAQKGISLPAKSLAGRKDFILASFISALMLLCIVPLQPSINVDVSVFEISETSGRDTVYEGDWAAYRQMPFSYHWAYNCNPTFALDKQTDSLAISDCSGKINIYHNSDWNVLIDTININSDTWFEFSSNGEYFVTISGTQFQIYRTSDWEWVYSDDVTPDDGSIVSIYDLTWSGDGQRVVFSTGNNGGKMYEGPDWSEVTGTNSNGYFVAHHPSEDILWYVSTDGSGNEYEYENIPFVGYQWVLKRSFTFSNSIGPLTSSPDGTILLMATNYDGISAYSSSDFSQLFSSYDDESPATFSSNGDYILSSDKSAGNYNMYSTDSWQKTTVLESSEDCYYGGAYNLAFTSNDSEILVASYQCSENILTGWLPDEDSDGVVDEQDLCPATPEEEESDVRGCAPSQKDTDLDGVNDRDDVCPRTATSDSANSIGCSESQLIDTDDDGVSDSDDLCPNTPATELGNIYGCSSSQRDVDGDGLVDSLDNCPLYDVESCSNVLSWTTNMAAITGTDYLYSPMWSPRGDMVAAYDSESKNILILDEQFLFVEQISIPEDYRLTADFSWHPDGDWLLLTWESASYSDSLCGYYIWYVENTTLSSNYELSNDCGNLAAHTLSPDGTRLALSLFSYDSYSGKAAMYDLINNSVEFEIDDYYPSYLSFSHDGSTLIGLTNSYILVWDPFDGYLLDSKSIGSRYSMIISPDSDFIYTWNDDNIKVYSLQSLALISLTSVSNEWSDDTSIADISFSRSNDLLYVSQSNATYFEDSYIINSSIQTYQISSTQSLEFVTETDTINDEFRRAIVSPNENSIFIQIYGNGNSGIFMWESDSDGDKISDLSDVCPHTELDETPDETGCSWGQKDDDEDNIFNNLDLCMGTVNGEIVDELGCSDSQVDEDLDGICDKDAPSVGPSDCFGVDICPDTLPGKNVNSMGCSWEQEDDDFDSVPNGIDICPETVYGDNPNEVGCGDKQRDSDEDSLKDYWDLCPSTEINASVDASGCSDFQVDTDSDTVCNMGSSSFGPSNCTGIDRCPNTMSNKSVDVNGCSWEQRDDDGDGVLNLHDSCPDTLKSDISPDGCSSWQRDADNDGVADALDQCAKTPPDEFSNQVGCSESQESTNTNAQGNDKLSTIQWISIGTAFMIVVALGGVLLKREKPEKNITLPESIVPPYEVRGMMKTDGKEWIEYPNGSGKLFYRDPTTGQWVNSK
ncbi:MAG TPA: WD40 repeat domain-containing protein [Candidatus Poseidoniaceae archaeon]|nr:WD40 repeat domain-containing protein [Candidatus Poseidoniaceae archaeon]